MAVSTAVPPPIEKQGCQEDPTSTRQPALSCDPAPTPHTAWEHFEHRADMGVAGRGPTPAAAFEQAALALTAVICDPATVRATQWVHISRDGGDLELLLVDWLNAVVYEMDSRRMLFSRFEVSIAGTRLEAAAWGEPVDPPRHQPAVEVKGATYTELAVARDPTGTWSARCVVDV